MNHWYKNFSQSGTTLFFEGRRVFNGAESPSASGEAEAPAVTNPEAKSSETDEVVAATTPALKNLEVSVRNTYDAKIGVLKNEIAKKSKTEINNLTHAEKIIFAKAVLLSSFNISQSKEIENISEETPYNQKFSKSKVVQIAYENIFFSDKVAESTGDFYVPEYLNDAKTKIKATPGNLRGVLKNCKEGDEIIMGGGTYEGPLFSAVNNITLSAEEGATPTISYSENKSGVKKIEEGHAGKKEQVDAGNALTLAGENSTVSGLTFDTPHVFTALKLKGNNSSVENCRFKDVVTGIHSEGVGNNIIRNTIKNYTKDGIIYGLEANKDGGTIVDNKIVKFSGTDEAHNDGIQLYVYALTSDGKIDYQSRFGGNLEANTITITGNTVTGDQGITMFNAKLKNAVISGNTVYATNGTHGITLPNGVDTSQIKNNKIFINGVKTENPNGTVNYIEAKDVTGSREKVELVHEKDMNPVSKTQAPDSVKGPPASEVAADQLNYLKGKNSFFTFINEKELTDTLVLKATTDWAGKFYGGSTMKSGPIVNGDHIEFIAQNGYPLKFFKDRIVLEADATESSQAILIFNYTQITEMKNEINDTKFTTNTKLDDLDNFKESALWENLNKNSKNGGHVYFNFSIQGSGSGKFLGVSHIGDDGIEVYEELKINDKSIQLTMMGKGKNPIK